MMDIRPLRSEADYDAALEAIETYFVNEPNRARRKRIGSICWRW